MSEYFTETEMNEVEKALKDIATVGVNIAPLSDDSRQRRVFFDKARLWHVINEVVRVLYLDKLKSGNHFFLDSKENKYRVISEKDFSDYQDLKKEEKWESGDTITIGEARKKLGIRRERFPSGEE